MLNTKAHRITALSRHRWHRIAWLLPLILSLNSQAQQTAPLYDVEVLIFRHTGPLTLKPLAIEDYTHLPIPQAHPSSDLDSARQPSPGMETTWRLLSNNGAYQPLLYTRWRQTSSDYNNPQRYRLHNDEAILRPVFRDNDDFGFDAIVPDLPQAPEPAPATTIPVSPLDTPWLDRYMPFPPTTTDPQHYSLDGWLSFSRQRFFHIAVALEQRSVDPWADSGDTLRSDDRINQNRRIEIGRFEYFDTAGLSVLVRVSEVALEELSQ